MNNNFLKYITIILFFGFIFIVPMITLFTPDKKISELENKILTPLPELTLDNIVDKSFMTNFAKYSGDHFPLRTDFLKLKNSYNYIVGNRKFRDVYISNNTRFMEQFIFNKTIIDQNISNTKKLSKFLYDNYNIKSTLMVVPTSIAFYEKELPLFAISDNQREVLNYIDSNINNNNLNFYNSYEILNKHKDSPIYFNTDHHWTQLGARLAYQDLYKKDSFTKPLNYKKVCDDFYGTYYSKALLPNVKGDSIYAYTDFNDFKISVDFNKEFDTLYDENKLNTKNKYQYFLHGDPAFAIIDGNSNNDDEILIFKDSYAHNFIPFLTSHYNKIHVVDPRYYNIDIKDYLSKNKNINNILCINNIQTFNSNNIYKQNNL